jgi:hypothetical protein
MTDVREARDRGFVLAIAFLWYAFQPAENPLADDAASGN